MFKFKFHIMEKLITTTKNINELSNIAPEKWETPQLFKTDFDNTESGKAFTASEGGYYHS